MSRSGVIIGALAVLTAVVLIPFSVVSPQGQRLLMVTWGMPFEDVLFHDGYAVGFENAHPGWSVDYQRHTDVADKYKAWHLQGRGADVMRLGIDDYHAMIRLGIVTPLTDLIDDPAIGLTQDDINDFFPAIWEALHVDGEVYALPADNAQYGVYYNRGLFDAYNSAHSDDPVEYPIENWTWAQLLEASKRLSIRDERGRVQQHGIAFDLWWWPFFTFLYQAGGEMWDEEQMTALVNSAEGIEALEFIVDLIPPDSPIRAADQADSGATPVELFKVGEVAILLDGSWQAPNIEQDNPDLEFAIAPLPRHRRAAVVSGSVVWAISSHSRHPRKAFEMIKWITGPEGSAMYWDTLRVAPPARRSIVESEGFGSTAGYVDPVTGERKAAMPVERFADRAEWLRFAITPDPATGESPGFVPAAPYQSDLQLAVARAMAEAVRGEKTPKQALDDAVARVHRIIDRDRRARGLSVVER